MFDDSSNCISVKLTYINQFKVGSHYNRIGEDPLNEKMFGIFFSVELHGVQKRSLEIFEMIEKNFV